MGQNLLRFLGFYLILLLTFFCARCFFFSAKILLLVLFYFSVLCASSYIIWSVYVNNCGWMMLLYGCAPVIIIIIYLVSGIVAPDYNGSGKTVCLNPLNTYRQFYLMRIYEIIHCHDLRWRSHSSQVCTLTIGSISFYCSWLQKIEGTIQQ